MTKSFQINPRLTTYVERSSVASKDEWRAIFEALNNIWFCEPQKKVCSKLKVGNISYIAVMIGVDMMRNVVRNEGVENVITDKEARLFGSNG